MCAEVYGTSPIRNLNRIYQGYRNHTCMESGTLVENLHRQQYNGLYTIFWMKYTVKLSLDPYIHIWHYNSKGDGKGN